MPTSREALSRWSQLHDGYDVDRSRLVRGWLHMVFALARVLHRCKVPPTAMTIAGVAAAGGAASSGRALSAPLVLVTAMCDGLDGAIAVQRGQVSRHGTLIDHAADRVTDVLFALALLRASADRRAVAADAALTLAYEASRSRARARAGPHALVTAGERPIRVVVTAMGLCFAPTAGAAAVAALCAVSLRQLFVARRTAA